MWRKFVCRPSILKRAACIFADGLGHEACRRRMALGALPRRSTMVTCFSCRRYVVNYAVSDNAGPRLVIPIWLGEGTRPVSNRHGIFAVKTRRREVQMIDQCANPKCRKPLRYFREGIIYAYQIPLGGPHDNGPVGHRQEHYWLCGPCSQTILEGQKAGKRSGLWPPSTLRNWPTSPALSSAMPSAS
jgi:hypothetical protein